MEAISWAECRLFFPSSFFPKASCIRMNPLRAINRSKGSPDSLNHSRQRSRTFAAVPCAKPACRSFPGFRTGSVRSVFSEGDLRGSHLFSRFSIFLFRERWNSMSLITGVSRVDASSFNRSTSSRKERKTAPSSCLSIDSKAILPVLTAMASR